MRDLFFAEREGCSAKNIFSRRRARKFLSPDFASPPTDRHLRKIFRIPHVTVPRTVTPLHKQNMRLMGAILYLRRGRDSNPRSPLEAQHISSVLHSTALAPLPGVFITIPRAVPRITFNGTVLRLPYMPIDVPGIIRLYENH